MLINDDGLQIIPEEERNARIEFYADNSIGWTARPKHNHNGFVRKGKFKKVCLFEFSTLSILSAMICSECGMTFGTKSFLLIKNVIP